MRNKCSAEGRIARSHVLDLDAVTLKNWLLRQSRDAVGAAMYVNVLHRCWYLALIKNDSIILDGFNVTFSYYVVTRRSCASSASLTIAHRYIVGLTRGSMRVSTARRFQSRKQIVDRCCITA